MSDILHDGLHICRKSRRCDQCAEMIHVGEKYRKQVYRDGDLQTYRAHEDCDLAAQRYAKLAELHFAYDDYPCLSDDLEVQDFYGWLLPEFPAVAARMNVHGPIRPAA